MYTATFLPIRTAFIDQDPKGLFELETIIDILFLLDVIINFCSAYIDKNTGFIEARFKNIARSYITSWFFFDLTACIPFQLMF
jgi:Ion transport protein